MFPHIAPPTPSTPKSLRPLGPGDFNFIRQIGQGAFGTVYLAQRSTSCSQSPREGRIVAIKACSKRELMSKSEESSRRKIAQLLDERNILESLVSYHGSSFFVGTCVLFCEHICTALFTHVYCFVHTCFMARRIIRSSSSSTSSSRTLTVCILE